MSWFDVLKYTYRGSKNRVDVYNRGEYKKIESFAYHLNTYLDKGETKYRHYKHYRIGGKSEFIKEYDLTNPNDIIELAKVSFPHGEYAFDIPYNGIDLTIERNLKYFLLMMGEHGYDMEGFNAAGLLQENVSGNPTKEDYSNKIKTVIQMLKSMNKPINKETIMYELDMDENQWEEKYDKLL